MPSMSELLEQYSALGESDVKWLHLLVGDWQVLSDLASADLVLWLPLEDGNFIALAQCRPPASTTVHYDDIVGKLAPDSMRPQLRAAFTQMRHQRPRGPRWFGSFAVREDVWPVVHAGHAIAVLARQANLGPSRTTTRMELAYIESADDLLAMTSRGEYPIQDTTTGQRRGSPRVVDGFIRLNADGEVLYASPNAMSCFHRLGLMEPLIGHSLLELASKLIERDTVVDEGLPLVLMGRAPWRADVETSKASISLRSIPLTDNGHRVGAVVLCRDVSELRRRERDLMTKDATIREIHHRVKNNLATVAALLRLQSRRLDSTETRDALQEAIRRVSTISMVHEFLSQSLDENVDLDDMFGRIVRLTSEVSETRTRIETELRGSFGQIPAESATALALVITELVSNAVEHAFLDNRDTGKVLIDAQRNGPELLVVVSDDGVGLDNVYSQGGSKRKDSGLGFQIVRTLVANELSGTIKWQERPGGGTEVVVRAKLPDGRR
ncbi:MAG: PAS domain-containing sensor histidine kinase [Cellulomonadaceae bacterium]|jgi:two-component sensor histidine kinase|nr:PAS domain-containing sensor histidine kinase [Cellulomonadaceae bacterium]